MYWAPTLYFQHESGGFEEVKQVGGMLKYVVAPRFRKPGTLG